LLLGGSEPARFKALVLMGLGLGRDTRGVSGVIGSVHGGSSVTGFSKGNPEVVLPHPRSAELIGIVSISGSRSVVDVFDTVDAIAFVANRSWFWTAFLVPMSSALVDATTGRERSFGVRNVQRLSLS